ncbi:VOC family protein [Rhodoferax koreense]|uniref:VOC family protein n=1 Tax=Rhodoferax koreensis TaxID=1842727 RepID=UPI0012FFD148|nr:VOC family protein [Rhodoferax koreense]
MNTPSPVALLINIDVPDLAAAVRFYEAATGLRLNRRLFGGSVAEMRGAAVPVYLLEKPEGSGAGPHVPQNRGYARHWTPLHLDFVVEDLDAAVANAIAAGATLETGPTLHAWGYIATLGDPFGHGLCFLQWTGQGYEP